MVPPFRQTRATDWCTRLLVGVFAVLLGACSSGSDESLFARQAQTIEAADMGVSHPVGLGYAADRKVFFVGQGSAAGGHRLAVISQLGDHLGSIDLAVMLSEPWNVGFDPTFDRVLVLDGQGATLLAVALNGSELGAIERFDISAWGVGDAQGMAVDPASGTLYVLDGAGARVLRITPGADRGFADAAVAVLGLGGDELDDVRGIAFNPHDGHLYVLSPERGRLYALTEHGRLLATRDVSDIHLGQPQGMVFAPSGDLTDDAAELSLYIADRGDDARTGGITEVSFLQPPPPAKPSRSFSLIGVTFTGPATLANVIDTSLYMPPSPDPSGIAYLNTTGTLLISDGEVNEIPALYTGNNLFEITLGGSLLATSTTDPAFSDEPTGVSNINPLNNRIFFSDDNDREISEMNPGPDLRYGTADDIVTEFSTRDFSPPSNDPEGVAFAPALGELFVSDGVNNEIYRVSPGPNGIFDGPPAGGGDDVVTSFDTAAAGLTDPEGIEYDTDDGTLLAVGNPRNLLFQFSVTGTLLSTIDISAAEAVGLSNPAGLTIAPSSQASGISVYIVDRRVDNNSDPNENDGLVFEVAGSSGPPVNRPPIVSAGPDQSISLPTSSVALNGTVLDDGLPTATVTTLWTQVSGPATVAFVDISAVDTTASFPTEGTYVLRLTADDSEFAPFDQLTVTVDPPVNQAPGVAAGPDQTITLPEIAALNGTVNDDGLPNPPGTVATTWSQVSGPGAVTFANALAIVTTASFPVTGTYVLRLTADDGEFAPSDQLTVTVDPPINQAPSVAAGPDQPVALPDLAALNGTASDDGLPNPPGTLTTTWSQVSGPGAVTFANALAIVTTASFPVTGTYVLRLTADDGEVAVFDELTVRVYPEGTQVAAVEVGIAAGADDAEESGAGAVTLDSTDLELVFDGGSEQTVGIRFNSVLVPQGATIFNAYVQFQVDEAGTEVTSLAIQGEATDNASPFTATPGSISGRARTASMVAWDPVPWTVVGEAGPDQRTPDIAAIIQEIVDRPGWLSDNSLAIIISGSGRRTAAAFEIVPTAAPRLYVEYGTGGAANQAPAVDAGPDQDVTLPSEVVLDATVSDDGLPAVPGRVSTIWSQESGPGTVVFADLNAVDTTASFPLAGTYVLRLTVDDGLTVAFDQLTIVVNPQATTPVDSGDDGSETSGEGSGGQSSTSSALGWLWLTLLLAAVSAHGRRTRRRR